MRRRKRPAAPEKPALDVETILGWCDAYHKKHKRWPDRRSGRVAGTDESWSALDGALFHGHRGLQPGGSLMKLLAEHRGYRHRNDLPDLRVEDVVRWAEAHRKRTGQWPTRSSGPVADAPGETWNAIDVALKRGRRGLVRQKGSTLARMLARRRRRPHKEDRPALSDAQVLRWAEAWHVLHGTWPTRTCGAVGSTGETWSGIDHALSRGSRGLVGGRSLFAFLKANGKVTGAYTPYRLKKPRARNAASTDAAAQADGPATE